MTDRVTARLSPPLAEYVRRMVGESGLYGTPAEYVRDLIRRDMERQDVRQLEEAVLDGYRDLASGHVFESTGDFQADMSRLAQEEARNWR